MSATGIISIESTMMHLPTNYEGESESGIIDNEDSTRSSDTVVLERGLRFYEVQPYEYYDKFAISKTESFDDDYDCIDDFSISRTGKGGWRSDKGTSLLATCTRKKKAGNKSHPNSKYSSKHVRARELLL